MTFILTIYLLILNIRWPQVKIARKDLRYFDSLGQGWFGWIVRGRYRKSKGEDKPDKEIDQSVIVCMLKEEANLAEKRSFLEDVQFAAQFSFLPEDNPNADIAKEDGAKNVIKLIGACVENPPFLAIYEECPQGDLKTFLLNSRGKIVGYAVIAFNQIPVAFYIFNLQHSKYISESLLANENFSGLILRFCRNVTSGLSFLHEFDCIPQDLAARCCQVTSTMEVKVLIAYFGYFEG